MHFVLIPDIIIISLLGVSACSLLANIAVINMYHRPAMRKMAPFTHWVIFGILGKVIHCRCPTGRNVGMDVGTVTEAWPESKKQNSIKIHGGKSTKLNLKPDDHMMKEDAMDADATQRHLARMNETLHEILQALRDPDTLRPMGNDANNMEAEPSPNQWQEAAEILDRLFFIIFLSTSVFTGITLLMP